MRAIVVPRRYVRLLLLLNPIAYCLIFAIMQTNGGESPFITTTPATTYRCNLRSLHVSGFMRRRFPLPVTDTMNSDLTAAIECSCQRSRPRDPEGRIPTAITISKSGPLLGGSIHSSLPGDRIHLWHHVPMGGHGEHVLTEESPITRTGDFASHRTVQETWTGVPESMEKGWCKVDAMIPCSRLLSVRRAAIQGVSKPKRPRPRIARADDEI